ncbi:hypothetical protein [Nonomuraea sp. NPDC052265]|uniref:hypothetical protein n=1 Tax=Nonomuraea sp. NPDC052265 TaxID=3364374 RepID=UPI0037C98129
MTVTDLHSRRPDAAHSRRPDAAHSRRLADQKETVGDLLGALDGVDEKLNDVDRCLNDLLRRITGADGDLSHTDYQDAMEDLEDARRAARNMKRIGAALHAEVQSLLDVERPGPVAAQTAPSPITGPVHRAGADEAVITAQEQTGADL